MTGPVGPDLPESLLAPLRVALDTHGGVDRVLLRSRLAPAGAGWSAHALTVVLVDPPDDPAAIREAALPVAPLLEPLIDALGENVGVRWPTGQALAVLEADNVVLYARGA